MESKNTRVINTPTNESYKKSSEKSDSEVTSNPTFWEHQTARTIPATRWRLVACFDSYGNRCEADMQVTLPSTDIFSPAAIFRVASVTNQHTFASDVVTRIWWRLPTPRTFASLWVRCGTKAVILKGNYV